MRNHVLTTAALLAASGLSPALAQTGTTAVPVATGPLSPSQGQAKVSGVMPGRLGPDHPFLTYEEPRDWDLRARVDVRSFQTTAFASNAGTPPVGIDFWNFPNVQVFFPVAEQTSYSLADRANTVATLSFDGDLYDDTPVYLERLAGDSNYVRLDANDISNGRQARLIVETRHRSWRVRIDEQGLDQIPWWRGDVPEEAKLGLLPTFGIDLLPQDQAAIRVRVDQWNGGNDPKNAPPYLLAKYFFRRIVEEIQPVGELFEDNLLQNIASRIQVSGIGNTGIFLRGPSLTLGENLGSEFDMAGLFVGACRSVGIPARTVIAVEVEDPFTDQFIPNPREPEEYRAFAEFYLYDERTGDGGWIPVDPFRQREREGNRVNGTLRDSYRFFGNHEDLFRSVPVAFNIHPPINGVTEYASPALWGWRPSSDLPPVAFQNIDISTGGAPVTAADMPRP